MFCIRTVIIDMPSRIELIWLYPISIELVLVLMVSVEVVVWIVLVKPVSGILQLVFLVYYIHRCTLILRLVCPQFTKKSCLLN